MALASAGLSWKVDGVQPLGPIDLGSFSQSTNSGISTVSLINSGGTTYYGCQIYLLPSSYQTQKQYDQLLWYGTAYPGYGLVITQSYSTIGSVTNDTHGVLGDFNRVDFFDIFAGSSMVLTSGLYTGASRIIARYDTYKKEFTLQNNFLSDVSGSKYKIDIISSVACKQGRGSSPNNAVSMIMNGGILKPGTTANFGVQIKIPEYPGDANNFYVDFVMIYQYAR